MLALVSLVCSALWLAYGIIVVNAFIYVPNMLGLFFSAVQVTINLRRTRSIVRRCAIVLLCVILHAYICPSELPVCADGPSLSCHDLLW